MRVSRAIAEVHAPLRARASALLGVPLGAWPASTCPVLACQVSGDWRISGVRGMGSLPLMFMAVDTREYAPDSEPKLSLSMSLSSNLLPCSASRPSLFGYGVCASVVCTIGLMLVLSGTFGGVGVPKDRRVSAHVYLVTGMKGILFRMSL